MTTLTKHHGPGNDFLVAFRPGIADLPAFARRVCDRSTGVGADGLLVGVDDHRMVLYNADGSRAEMSGNGIRCFAQALAARRGDLSAQTILTDAGLDERDAVSAYTALYYLAVGQAVDHAGNRPPTPAATADLDLDAYPLLAALLPVAASLGRGELHAYALDTLISGIRTRVDDPRKNHVRRTT